MTTAPTIRRRVAVALLAGFVSLAGCSSDATDGSGASDDTATGGAATPELPTIDDDQYVPRTGTDAVDIDVIDNSYDERYVAVSVGTTVTWTNKGETEHNVTPSVPGSFTGVASEDFLPGATHSVTFDEPGDFLYHCTIHATVRQGQTGAVRVVA